MLDEASVSAPGGGGGSCALTVPDRCLLPQKFDIGCFPCDSGKSSREWLPTKHVLQIRSAGRVLSTGTGDGGPERRNLSQALSRHKEPK